jgi:hypothetical protein
MNCVTEDHKLQGETRIGGEVSRTVNMKKKKRNLVCAKM